MPNHEIIHVVDSDAHFYSIYDLVGADSYAENVNFNIDDVKLALSTNNEFGIRLSDKTVLRGDQAINQLRDARVVLEQILQEMNTDINYLLISFTLSLVFMVFMYLVV